MHDPSDVGLLPRVSPLALLFVDPPLCLRGTLAEPVGCRRGRRRNRRDPLDGMGVEGPAAREALHQAGIVDRVLERSTTDGTDTKGVRHQACHVHLLRGPPSRLRLIPPRWSAHYYKLTRFRGGW